MGIFINGTEYTVDQLTYREQRLMRKTMRELNEDDPDFDPSDAATVDFVPAMVYVVMRRDNPEFSMDQALDFKPSDLEPPTETTKAAGKRPTRAAAKK